MNNRDGRRQKKVYGFVTFQEGEHAAACIESAKAGIEIEPGRPLSVRSAFFMPRRNSFESEKVSHNNWQNSSQPSEPTIHSRSPSPDFTTGEWKPEMANQVNGNYKQPMTVEEQAKKLFEIFQNLPEHAQSRILQVRIFFFSPNFQDNISFFCKISIFAQDFDFLSFFFSFSAWQFFSGG